MLRPLCTGNQRLGRALALAVLSLATPARADPFHAQTVPIGQRAIGMGGAFTAVANDPSAAYYNPAGLVITSDTTLSASLTLTAFDRSRVDGGYRTSAGISALSQDSATSVPLFVAAAKQLGARDLSGRRRHGVALTTFTVDQRRLSFDVEVRNRQMTSGTNFETLAIENSDRTSWQGLSYAYRLWPQLSLGVSGFLSVRRLRHTEERIAAGLGSVNPDGTFATAASMWTSHLVESNVKNLVARLGVLYAVDERLRLGLMFQPPSIHMRGRARVRERALAAELEAMPPASSLRNTSQRGLASYSPIPWELRVGSSYAVRPRITLALDASLYGRTGSKQDPVVAIGKRKPDAETGAVPELGAFVSETWYRRFNGNVNLGLQAVIKQTISVRSGIYTDFSSAPSVPRFTSTFYPSNVHRVGGAVSLGLVTDDYDLSLGVIGVLGRGRGLSFNADPGPEAPTYERTRVQDRMLFVFINGVQNAVKALAEKADEKLREVRSREREPRAREGAGEPAPEPEPR